MLTSRYPVRHDVIVVGARAAGAATALLLARAGLSVLLVDRSRYGADTISTHALMRGGVLQLRRWGLLDEIIASGAPPVRRTTFHVGSDVVPITIKPSFGVDALYAPRRTVLDRVLVDAAMAAGAEVRFGVTVTGLDIDADGRVHGIVGQDEQGRPVRAAAAITIGADGMRSKVADAVGAVVERSGSAAGAFAYGYWTGLEPTGYEWFFRPGVSAGAIPTNDGATCVFVSTTPERLRRELRPEVSTGFFALLGQAAPELRERMATVGPPDRIRRFGGLVGYLRRPWGPGWALVGDAGYFKDPIAAHGLTDAMRDAELVARAVTAVVRDGGDEATELATYQKVRDRLSTGLFTAADSIASYTWDATEVNTLLLRLSSAMADEVEALVALDDDPVLALAG